jgi:flagellar biosynthesis chaperone FliJ
MDVLTTLMIIGVATVAGETLTRLARTRAGSATQVQPQIDQLQQQVDSQASALAEVQSHLAGQEDHVRELQERLDFAERLLTQAQERAALNPAARQPPGPA